MNENRKFRLTVAVQFATTAALFAGFLTGAEYVTVTTLTLGVYGAANVAAKKVTQ